MRTMYDSVNAGAIPTSAQLVAGYVSPSGFAWSAASWARFPNSVLVRITPQASHTGVGIQVLDVESGDATPAQAPGWAKAQRALGQDPTVYCSQSTWASVQAAFNSQGVAQPHYWIASYPGGGSKVLPSLNGIVAVAHQWADPNGGSGGQYDLSTVADVWPGVDTGVVDVNLDDSLQPYSSQPTSAKVGDALFAAYASGLQQNGAPGGETYPNQFQDLKDAVTALAAQVKALAAQVQTQGAGSVTLVPTGTITLAPEAK